MLIKIVTTQPSFLLAYLPGIQWSISLVLYLLLSKLNEDQLIWYQIPSMNCSAFLSPWIEIPTNQWMLRDI